ncbi:glycosyltransferase [Winogradskyella sp. R77965]|uniref:glycosyltransferase n=1 Tax=Winogradskyella sp. R77965 TaxID=3093872 RepID=UPI0037DC9FE8
MSLNSPIKVTFILPTLFAGGSERIFSFLAQNIDKDRFETTLLVIGKSSDAAYDIKGIKVVFLEKLRVLNGIPALYSYLRSSKPDIVLSVIGHLNTIMAYLSVFFPKTKFIARESTVLSVDAEFFNHSKGLNPIALLVKNRFNFFDKIICQSQDMLSDLKNGFNVKKDKLVVINNPITEIFEIKNRDFNENVLKLVTVARFSKEKGIPRILEILSKLTIPFHYTLIGMGPEKESIFRLIKDYGLTDKITHIPFTKDVSKFLKANDLFLQGSYFEGFPNCLIESCVVGTPVIAFNVPGGTKEIVVNGINGFLVDDEHSFIKKIEENKIWSPEEIRNSVLNKFNKGKILSEYEELFLNILEK